MAERDDATPQASPQEAGAGAEQAAPDVTVVVAVYNTMPYLEECLTSLVEQSIGPARMEVVAVDDGSTDGSGELLDRFAAEQPEVFTVLHQPNSGGPADPSNKALDVARGRYVYFLGADDHLGPEALERMVDFADAHGSDVVAGRMVGVNGRVVGQGLYGADQVDVDLFGPHLRWAMSNTKLFRRALLDKHGIRYREDMAFGSDQPFTLAACVHAERISVLASYVCYYAVKRGDASNMSYRTPFVDRLACIRQMMQAVADLVPAGRDRDTLLTRHFAWEIPRLLGHDLLQRPVEEQHEVCRGIAGMAQVWLSDRILGELSVSARLRVSAAVRDDLDRLAALVVEDTDTSLPVHVEAGQAFAGYTGFRDGDLPDRLFRLVPAGVGQRLTDGVALRDLSWSARSLLVELELPLVGPDAARVLAASLRRVDGPETLQASVRVRPGEAGSALTVEADRSALLRAGAGTWRVQLHGSLDGRRYDVRLPAPKQQPLTLAWHRGRPWRLRVTSTPNGRALAVAVEPVPVREAAAAVRRRVRSRLGRS